VADVAIGKPCPKCGTLTTFAGARHDTHFSATCPCCGYAYVIDNPNYDATAANVALKATLQAKATEDENVKLRAQVAALEVKK
jgi:DNA-directed RNA polymerase subunit M/transcription elongation factor TFIIS